MYMSSIVNEIWSVTCDWNHSPFFWYECYVSGNNISGPMYQYWIIHFGGLCHIQKPQVVVFYSFVLCHKRPWLFILQRNVASESSGSNEYLTKYYEILKQHKPLKEKAEGLHCNLNRQSKCVWNDFILIIQENYLRSPHNTLRCQWNHWLRYWLVARVAPSH